MDDIRDIDDLKDGIKAILTSLSGKCTENEFKDVFEEFFNCKISEAYKLCGGKAINFKDFLNKMSDICSYKKQDNGEIFITKVWNKDSKHVDMLNKVTKKDIYKNNDQVNKNSSIKVSLFILLY
jgi:predicted transcriptional regulator